MMDYILSFLSAPKNCNAVYTLLMLCSFAVIVALVFKIIKIKTALVCIFVFDFLAFFPLVYAEYGAYVPSFGLINIFKLFTMELEFDDLSHMWTAFAYVTNLPDVVNTLKITTALLYLFSPLLSATFVLGLIMDNLKKLGIVMTWRKNIHVFSQLNEASLSLANSIAGRGNKIIFADDSPDKDARLEEECEAKKYVVMNSSVHSISGIITRQIIRRNLSVYFIDSDENVALEKMMSYVQEKIIEEKKKIRAKVKIYLFSSAGEAEWIVDNYKEVIKNIPEERKNEKKNFNVILRLVDVAQLVSYKMLDTYPLYDGAKKDDGVNITVIGLGYVGTNIAKDVLWCGIMPDWKPPKLNIVDIRGTEDQQSNFEYFYPELTSKGEDKEGYFIRYYSADAQSTTFDKLLENDDNIKNTNYIVVSLGDDQLNIVVAQNIRMKFYRYHRRLPVIVTVIRDQARYESVKDVFAKMRIYIVGNNEDMYTQETIETGKLYTMAHEVSKAYDKCYAGHQYVESQLSDYLNKSEEEIRSNLSYAIHIDYKFMGSTGYDPKKTLQPEEESIIRNLYSPFTCVKGKKEPCDKKCYCFKIWSENIDKINRLEHERWNAYERGEGRVRPFETIFPCGEEIRKFSNENAKMVKDGIEYTNNKLHKSNFSKMHGCLIDYDALEYLATNNGRDKDVFKEYDQTLNTHAYAIWKASHN